MAKANQRKNAKRPSPRGKKLGEGNDNRAKAKSLFDKWADDRTIIQLSKSFLGIRFIGKLVHFGKDDEHYLFKTGSGVTAEFPLIIYDKISVDSVFGSSTPVVTETASPPASLGWNTNIANSPLCKRPTLLSNSHPRDNEIIRSEELWLTHKNS